MWRYLLLGTTIFLVLVMNGAPPTHDPQPTTTPVLTASPTQTRTPTHAPSQTVSPTLTPQPTSFPTSTLIPTLKSTSTATRIPTTPAAPTHTFTPTSTRTSTPIPGVTTTPTGNLSFPIRAAFYYPWFPEAWTQLNTTPYTNYHPLSGMYDSSSVDVIHNHITAMQYGKVQVGIASWWGPGSQTDGRIATILNATHQSGYDGFRWALYYEKEGTEDPIVSVLASHLAYIRDHYTADPNYLKINNRFVIFVYNANDTTCDVVDRWKQANAAVDAYIVLKVFPNYLLCANQPDSWHQYGPNAREDQQGTFSFTISPGYWKVNEAPGLARDPSAFRTAIRDMLASQADWQLITTFDEWGEGTSVEDAVEWQTSSGFGEYLDALHDDGAPVQP